MYSVTGNYIYIDTSVTCFLQTHVYRPIAATMQPTALIPNSVKPSNIERGFIFFLVFLVIPRCKSVKHRHDILPTWEQRGIGYTRIVVSYGVHVVRANVGDGDVA